MKVPDPFEWFLMLPKWLLGGETGRRNKVMVFILTAVVFVVGGGFVAFQLGIDFGLFTKK